MKLRSWLAATAFSITSFTISAYEHYTIDPVAAERAGFNLQGLQWLKGYSAQDESSFNWTEQWAGVRWATAIEVKALLANANLDDLDLIFFEYDNDEVVEIRYGGIGWVNASGYNCLSNEVLGTRDTVCKTTKEFNFSLTHADEYRFGNPDWSKKTLNLLVKIPNYTPTKSANEWDGLLSVSASDGPQLDLSGLTWMRYPMLQGMSSLDIRQALQPGGSLSDWRFATKEEMIALFRSDKTGEVSRVFLGSKSVTNLNMKMAYQGFNVSKSDCSPLSMEKTPLGEDQVCTVAVPSSSSISTYDEDRSYNMYTYPQTQSFIFLPEDTINSNSNSFAYVIPMLVKE
ncbi:hypothetical protein [Pseudoalteromonas xiamenensis]